MLTLDEEQRVHWAKKHKNDDFNTTIFTDESSFQLFRKKRLMKSNIFQMKMSKT